VKFPAHIVYSLVLAVLLGISGCGGGGGGVTPQASQLAAAPAHATRSSWSAAVASCGHAGNGYADGCSSAPAGGQYLAPTATDSFGGTSWYGYAAQSGQVWTSAHPWPWDQAAIDYAIGPVQSKAASKDPATLPTSGAVCTYSATGSPNNGPQVTCQPYGGSTVADLEGYDFSLHGCTVLRTQSVTSVILKNDWFQNGSNCDFTQSFQIVFYGNSSIDIESSVIDGNFPDYKPVDAVEGMIDDSRRTCPSLGTFTVKYTAFVNAAQRPISANACNSSRLIEYSYFGGYGLSAQGQHQEIIQDSTPENQTVDTVQYSFDTILQPKFDQANDAGTTGIAIFSAIPNYDTINYTNVGADHMVIVGNKSISGTSATNVIGRGIWIAYNNFGTADWNENYIDPTGMYWAYSASGVTSLGTTNWNGNNSVDLLDGSACYGYDAAQTCAGHQ
jgi:hypothetical protein